eukprot:TRINITY_DN37924_c0_g1_i1.p1 TRINITY_DN37924_c0_g1~~TRINITY_DN37924_c0_g1_i1.p1  ORF type:complete len:550 (+),score=174.07 TRINITY_DN37924_c0_g1_i1:217-1866(+)
MPAAAWAPGGAAARAAAARSQDTSGTGEAQGGFPGLPAPSPVPATTAASRDSRWTSDKSEQKNYRQDWKQEEWQDNKKDEKKDEWGWMWVKKENQSSAETLLKELDSVGGPSTILEAVSGLDINSLPKWLDIFREAAGADQLTEADLAAWKELAMLAVSFGGPRATLDLLKSGQPIALSTESPTAAAPPVPQPKAVPSAVPSAVPASTPPGAPPKAAAPVWGKAPPGNPPQVAPPQVQEPQVEVEVQLDVEEFENEQDATAAVAQMPSQAPSSRLTPPTGPPPEAVAAPAPARSGGSWASRLAQSSSEAPAAGKGSSKGEKGGTGGTNKGLPPHPSVPAPRPPAAQPPPTAQPPPPPSQPTSGNGYGEQMLPPSEAPAAKDRTAEADSWGQWVDSAAAEEGHKNDAYYSSSNWHQNGGSYAEGRTQDWGSSDSRNKVKAGTDGGAEAASKPAAMDEVPRSGATSAGGVQQARLGGAKLADWLRRRVFELRVSLAMGHTELLNVLQTLGDEQLEPPFEEAKLWLGLDETETMPPALEQLITEFREVRQKP